MQMTGRMPPFSAVTSKRSMRFGFKPRLGRAGDDDELIDVGDEHVLPAAAGAADDAVPRLDALDDPLRLALRAKPDDVARRHHVPLIGGQRLQQPPRRTLKASRRCRRARC